MNRILAPIEPSGGAWPPVRGPERFAFVLVPNFSMIAFAAALEPLRIANRMADRELYRWHIVAKNGGPVRASNGCTVATDRLVDCNILQSNLFRFPDERFANRLEWLMLD